MAVATNKKFLCINKIDKKTISSEKDNKLLKEKKFLL
jgi:hypothetical protein